MLSPRQRDCPTDAEIERSAFNAAFFELGLRWHWDDSTYAGLASEPCERSRVRHYVQTMQPHLLTAYDADFLADAVVRAKQRCQKALAHCTSRTLPRGNWTDPRWGEIGI